MDLNDVQAARPKSGWPRKVGTYLVHFSVGVIGVFVTAILLASILDPLSLKISAAIFSGPLFLGQLLLGFLAGVTLNRKLRSKSAIWVWVLPAVWLIAAIPSAFGSSDGPNGWGVLFGTKCGDCLEQLLTVCPFYGSVAYSVGAWAGLDKAS